MLERDEWVKYTNIAIRGQRQAATNRGELIKYLGIHLATVLETRQGSVAQFFGF